MIPIPDIFLTPLNLSLARHLHFAFGMTTAVSSDLGAGFELGGLASGGLGLSGQAGAGLGPATDWTGGAWNAHSLAASSDPATGPASTAPSFRSSWQSVVNTWSGATSGSGDGEEETSVAGSAAEGEGASTPGLAGKTGNAATSANAKAEAGVAQAQHTGSAQNATAGVQSQTGKIPVTARAIQAAIAESASAASDLSVSRESAARESAAKAGHDASAAPSGRVKKKTQHTVSGAQLAAPLAPAPFALPVAALKQTSTLSPASRKVDEALASNQFAGKEAALSDLHGVADRGILSSPSVAVAAAHNTNQSQATQDQTATVGVATAVDEPSSALSEAPLHGVPAARGVPTGEDCSNQVSARENANTVSSTASVASPGGNAAAGAAVASVAGVDHAVTAQTGAHPAAGADLGTAKSAVERSLAGVAAHESIKTDGKGSGAPPVAAFHAASADAASVAVLRTPAAAHVSTTPAANHAQAAPSSATTTAQDTFSALDAGSAPGNPIWTHAGSHHVEAGFRDPDLGWVGVRANLSASGVHATLVPSSADAAQALSGRLAGLDAHLNEQHAQVASLSMASPGDGGMGSGAGQQMQQGTDRNAQGSPQGNLQTRPEGIAARLSNDSGFSSAPQSGSLELLSQAGAMRGTRISVVA